jgi:hypothetical protein
MPKNYTIGINGTAVRVNQGTAVAAAVLNSGCVRFRYSISGEWRTPLCRTGVCFECRLKVDGVSHARSCRILCRDGMRIETDDRRSDCRRRSGWHGGVGDCKFGPGRESQCWTIIRAREDRSGVGAMVEYPGSTG